MNNSELNKEIELFGDLWHRGFYSGDPLNPNFSIFGIFGYMGISHAIYLACIKPYIHNNTTVLEIGPGRGAWTKTFLNAKEIYCIDALSAEHNKFIEYVGNHKHIKYFKVVDFACKELPDNKFDYLFSYDVFCHISFNGIGEYLKNLYPKLKKNANCFLMVADYNKYNSFLNNLNKYSVFNEFRPKHSKPVINYFLNIVSKRINNYFINRHDLFPLDINETQEPRSGRWYHAGIEKTCELLMKNGYTVIDEDMMLDFRSPIIHFIK
jgi:hypothetical protein